MATDTCRLVPNRRHTAATRHELQACRRDFTVALSITTVGRQRRDEDTPDSSEFQLPVKFLNGGRWSFPTYCNHTWNFIRDTGASDQSVIQHPNNRLSSYHSYAHLRDTPQFPGSPSAARDCADFIRVGIRRSPDTRHPVRPLCVSGHCISLACPYEPVLFRRNTIMMLWLKGDRTTIRFLCRRARGQVDVCFHSRRPCCRRRCISFVLAADRTDPDNT
jgi:hypothetical protein